MNERAWVVQVMHGAQVHAVLVYAVNMTTALAKGITVLDEQLDSHHAYGDCFNETAEQVAVTRVISVDKEA